MHIQTSGNACTIAFSNFSSKGYYVQEWIRREEVRYIQKFTRYPIINSISFPTWAKGTVLVGNFLSFFFFEEKTNNFFASHRVRQHNQKFRQTFFAWINVNIYWQAWVGIELPIFCSPVWLLNMDVMELASYK